MTAWLERHQVAVYLLALALGVAVGLVAPASAPAFELMINPALIVLLYATFLAVPFAQIRDAVKDLRFLGATMLMNFVFVPLVVFGLSRFVAGEQALLIGVLLVLLTPCVDYVMVFTRLAGGASDRLLAASPLLMLLQMLLLPVYLLIFVGPDVTNVVDSAPFVQAFLLLIVLPLTLAIATQLLAKTHLFARRLESAMQHAMVPVMTIMLFVVVTSQIDGVRVDATFLTAVVPIYIAFLAVMPVIGWGMGWMLRLDVPRTKALIFSGATRNSLVVLPLALALPEPFRVVAVVVVAQTLIELIGMVIYVRVIPRLVRSV